MNWYTVLVKDSGFVVDTWCVQPPKLTKDWRDKFQADIDDIKSQFNDKDNPSFNEEWQYDDLIQELEDRGYEFGDSPKVVTVYA